MKHASFIVVVSVALSLTFLLHTQADESAAPTAVAIGPGAEASKTGVAIGMNAKSIRENGVAIGHNAQAKGFPSVAKGSGYETTAVGADAIAAGWRCSAFGDGAQAHVVSATALGRGAFAHGPHMIAIGRGAFMHQIKTAPDLNVQNACGIAGDSLWLGGMLGHKVIDTTGDTYVHDQADGGDGKARWNVRTFVPRTYTIHGMDAYDARFDQAPDRFDADKFEPDDKTTWMHREDKDVAGGNLHLAAGRGTGTAAGGAIALQTAPVGNTSRNRKNPLNTAIKVDTDYNSNNATPMWLWDNNARKLKRVMVGPPNSGGQGFRALVIAN